MRSCFSARVWLIILTLAAGGCLAAPGGYPDKPVRMVVPYVAGGSFDTVGRILAQRLAESWGQQVIVDNRAGATGVIGTQTVARAAADGYTIGLFGGNQVLSTAVRADPAYDMQKDFAPIARVATLDNVVVCHPSLAAGTLRDLIALLKRQPEKYHYGSGGHAGDTHFSGALFSLQAGVNIVHVPYKGGGLAVTGLLANEVQIMVVNMISADPHVRSGRIRGLAIAGKARSALQPEIPTAAEAGLPGLEWSQWYAVFAPAGTPRAIASRLHHSLAQAVATAEVSARLTQQGARPMMETPEQLAAFVRESLVVSRKIASAANIRAEQ